MAEQYLTVTAARQRMGVSEGKIASMIRNGELPTIPNPRNRSSKLIPQSAVDKWLEAASVVPPVQRKKRAEEQREQESGREEQAPAA